MSSLGALCIVCFVYLNKMEAHVERDWDDARERLKDLNPEVRQQALQELLAAWRAGEIICQPPKNWVNLHCHTFFSYNGYGHSPTSLVWLAKESGWRALATVDFDVLDGVEETLAACDQAAVRGGTGIETRAYLPEFAQHEMSSPGEPGVLYHIGVGFVSKDAPPAAAASLEGMRRRAAERNRDMVARINAYLAPVTIDYARDVLPLTPSGNATERHILIAYDAAARRLYPQRGALVEFWAGKLGLAPEKVDAFLGERPFPHDAIRSKLMKRGGVGYVQPGPESFPSFDEVTQTIIACGAIPLFGWLDGTSSGEQRIGELLELAISKGVAGLNIIPDRNWNLPDPAERELKVRKLYEVVELARALDLPIIVGTEMNKPGQRIIDDFEAEPLRPLVADFVRGADFLYGHTLMQRALGLGYQSVWARRHLPTRRERNLFYQRVGEIVPPGAMALGRVASLPKDLDPEALLGQLERMDFPQS